MQSGDNPNSNNKTKTEKKLQSKSMKEDKKVPKELDQKEKIFAH